MGKTAISFCWRGAAIVFLDGTPTAVVAMLEGSFLITMQLSLVSTWLQSTDHGPFTTTQAAQIGRGHRRVGFLRLSCPSCHHHPTNHASALERTKGRSRVFSFWAARLCLAEHLMVENNFNTTTEEAVYHSNYELDKDNQPDRNQFRVVSRNFVVAASTPAGTLSNILSRSMVLMNSSCHSSAHATMALSLQPYLTAFPRVSHLTLTCSCPRN
jgi:hypothetical protein